MEDKTFLVFTECGKYISGVGTEELMTEVNVRDVLVLFFFFT